MQWTTQSRESLLFVGEQQQQLKYFPVRKGSVSLFHESEGGLRKKVFEEGTDYAVNYETGSIVRTPGSTIPDWRNHALFGQTRFDHTQFSSYSNDEYTLFVDYDFDADSRLPNDALVQTAFLNGAGDALGKLFTRNKPLTYVVFGDSISTGGEASQEQYMYFHRFAAFLESRYPGLVIDLQMKAVGGETTEGGLRRLEQDVIGAAPDLVTIAFGMNDQNHYPPSGNGVPPEQYKANIRTMVEGIKSRTNAEIILISSCAPNPLWRYSSPNVGRYADVVRELGEAYGLAVADVYRSWTAELHAGKTHESLLLNNINHPNDYGHSIYFETLRKLF